MVYAAVKLQLLMCWRLLIFNGNTAPSISWFSLLLNAPATDNAFGASQHLPHQLHHSMPGFVMRISIS